MVNIKYILALNIENFVLFHTISNPPPPPPSRNLEIKIENKRLNEENYVKFLGVLYSQLEASYHRDNKKLSKTIGIFYKLTEVLHLHEDVFNVILSSSPVWYHFMGSHLFIKLRCFCSTAKQIYSF